MALSTGQVLNNRYRVVKLLAQGGFGAVYRGWDINLSAPVALKENLAASAESIRQFGLEARLLASLRQGNLPFVIDHFIVPDQGQYLVMEFIEGQDLQSMLKEKGPLPEAQVVAWICEIVKAVSYLHSQTPPIIHRDIKPANIKITPKGKVILVDFGIAKVYQPTQQTTVGAQAVTLGFSPPEQYGEGITDECSDVYALGATTYALLTGQTPIESLQRQLGSPLLTPRQLNPDISLPVEQVVLRAMELEKRSRFQSAGEFGSALSNQPTAPQIVQKQADYAAPLQKTVRAEPPANYEQTVVVPTPDETFKKARAPAKSTNWMGIILVIGVILCLTASLGGLGVYAFIILPDNATKTENSRNLGQTATALSLQLMTKTPTASDLPTLSWTASPEPFQTFTSTPFVTHAATITASLTPSPTETENPKATWSPCPGTYPSRLRVGDRAQISFDPPLPNRVRSQPNTTSTIIGHLEVGEKMEILEGPVCSQGWIWWRVRSLEKNLQGWTAEGDDQNYWLVPIP